MSSSGGDGGGVDTSAVLASFVAITNCAPSDAHTVLRRNGYNLELATNDFFENGVGERTSTQKRGRSEDATGHTSSPVKRRDTRSDVSLGDDDGAGVRAPRSTVVRQLLPETTPSASTGHRGTGAVESLNPFANFDVDQVSAGSGWTHPSLSSMFEPPHDLLFHGSFSQLCTFGERAQRWLLVNMQDPEEFRSHQMNRDTWRHSQVRQYVSEEFVLWQQQCTAESGQFYCQLYRVTRKPHVAILDPSTRMVVWRSDGFIDGERLSEVLRLCVKANGKPDPQREPTSLLDMSVSQMKQRFDKPTEPVSGASVSSSKVSEDDAAIGGDTDLDDWGAPSDGTAWDQSATTCSSEPLARPSTSQAPAQNQERKTTQQHAPPLQEPPTPDESASSTTEPDSTLPSKDAWACFLEDGTAGCPVQAQYTTGDDKHTGESTKIRVEFRGARWKLDVPISTSLAGLYALVGVRVHQALSQNGTDSEKTPKFTLQLGVGGKLTSRLAQSVQTHGLKRCALRAVLL